ncbi:SDR family oxidoreductase [Streptomyces sp. NPDC006367]|uniref:SDR family oxidoreductase n=1 Tax=unclassified Streptomyces TaxID=2593676 RepID=UPI0033B11282
MTTVITGATGFLGSHLLLRLMRGGHRVTALVRQDPAAARKRLARALAAAGAGEDDLAALPGVRLVRSDVTRPLLGLDAVAHRALAERAEEIWHCAAGIDLRASLDALTPVNVDGTRHVLELAARRPGGPARLVHISTAFVAGARPAGTVAEDRLDDSHGFALPYEATKHLAEHLVREWADRTGAAVTVLRPSVLISHRRVPPGCPHHPLSAIGVQLALAARQGPRRLAGLTGAPLAPGEETLTLRLHLPHGSAMNFVPVDYAADAMVRLAAAPPPGVRTCHVVHPVDTPNDVWLPAVVSTLPWVRLVREPEPVPLGPLESFLSRLTPTGDHYGRLTRRYDRPALDAADAAAGVAPPPPLDARYFRAALGHRPGGGGSGEGGRPAAG